MSLNKTATYIPAPNWDIPADSNLVVLGRLIKDPKNPESPVARMDVKVPAKVYEGQKIGWHTVYDQTKNGKIGIWAKCMQVVGGGMSFSQMQSNIESLEFGQLETRYFVPDDVYIGQAVLHPGVQAYLTVTNHRKPIYLITGIKIARNPKAKTQLSTSSETSIELKADATSFGGPVEVGPETSLGRNQIMMTGFSGSTDYIFAYRLTKIRVKMGNEDVSHGSYVKGAAFGQLDDEDEELVYDWGDEVNGGFPEDLEEFFALD